MIAVDRPDATEWATPNAHARNENVRVRKQTKLNEAAHSRIVFLLLSWAPSQLI